MNQPGDNSSHPVDDMDEIFPGVEVTYDKNGMAVLEEWTASAGAMLNDVPATMTDAQAVQYVIDEMNAQWESFKADFHEKRLKYPSFGVDTFVAQWMLIFMGEEHVKSVLHGIPMGEIIDDEMKRGRQVPPEIKAYRDAWWANIVACDMTKPAWERWTPEGKKAARDERDASRKLARKQASAKREAAKSQQLLPN